VIKKLISSAVVIGLITLAGCSGSSPSPKPIPTPANDAWGLSLVAGAQSLLTNQQVNIVATVTKNGQPAPDGTTVEFDVSGPTACYADASSLCAGFSSGKVTQASVATSGGKAAVLFVSLQAGTFTIRARVASASTTTTLTYQEPSTTSNLEIFSVVPSQGSLAGGDQVTFFGKGILTPVEVFFKVGGNEFAGQIVSVDSGGLSATVITPAITGVDASKGWSADVRFVSGSGTAFEQTKNLPGVFQFLPSSAAPEIYQVFPDHGSARGGEQVTIFGQNFQAPAQVQFVVGTDTLEAQEVNVSSDGRQITVITPQVSAVPLQKDESATVTVISGAGTANEKTVSKSDAYVFTADQLTPNISSVSPNSGPVTGGTQVTIFGTQTSDSGFQFPVQVTFGGGSSGIPAREAQVVSVNLHQIVCITPDVSNDLSKANVTPPVAVDITVTNVDSGLSATAQGIFTYGEALFISGNTPAEGPSGTLVTIFGSGFQTPLTVDWVPVTPGAPTLRLEVVSVSGSEVVVRMPALTPPLCDDALGQFLLKEVDTNLSTTGGEFTYLGNLPKVLSVDNPIVTPSADGLSIDSPNPNQVVISGSHFIEPVRVTIGNYVMPDGDVAVSDGGTKITVKNLPSPKAMGLVYDTGTCVNGSGVQGVKDAATPVDITVTNLTGGCSAFLPGGLVYEPYDLTCRIPPTISLSTNALNFGDQASGGACPSGNIQVLDISNVGDSTLTWSAAISGPDAADFTVTDPAPPTGSIDPGDPATPLTIDFCPATAGSKSATLTITSNDPNNPSVSVTLSGNGT